MMLKRLDPRSAEAARKRALDPETTTKATSIVDAVRDGGEEVLRRFAEEFGDVAPGSRLWMGRAQLEEALTAISSTDRELLSRVHDRIRAFATAQRAALSDVSVPVPGGRAGHRVSPVATAGCYAPGGRFPLPSSVLMTAGTAKAAGVEHVWVASPKPTTITLAAAAIAGAEGVLCVGGAQAIAALAYGCGPIPRCDAVVGPGNRWVTAAKSVVSSDTRIDMLAGPSELLVIADATACARMIAADLLAQAEHDPDAIPMVISTDEPLIDEIQNELEQQLARLTTAPIAREALANGFVVYVPKVDQAVALSNRIAPEHLQVMTQNARAVSGLCANFGGLFIGSASAEVFGDYGAGPNHTLPTGGTARFSGGLSVMDFLVVRTWLELDDAGPLIGDSAALAALEGLDGHRKAALARTDSEFQ